MKIETGIRKTTLDWLATHPGIKKLTGRFGKKNEDGTCELCILGAVLESHGVLKWSSNGYAWVVSGISPLGDESAAISYGLPHAAIKRISKILDVPFGLIEHDMVNAQYKSDATDLTLVELAMFLPE